MASASELFSSVPAGALVPYAGSTAPAGWLLCYGQAVSRTTYAALFSALGTTYGAGDGSTTFNLPDLEGRTVFGKDDMSGSAAGRLNNTGIDGDTANPDGTTLGATGGADRRNITRTGARDNEPTGTPLEEIATTIDGVSIEPGPEGSGTFEVAATPPAIVLNYIIKA
jgi:microcystin-dependent protein